MHDIFISYSSKDRSQALTLAEGLYASGYSCWMDQTGVDAAVRWSSEIADALSECKAMLIVLSASSLASENVVKELNLAVEWKKSIVPVVLEEVNLTKDFAYHLSGVQRVGIENTVGIARALEKIGVKKELRNQESIRIAIPYIQPLPSNAFFRLAVLPFEDLSPSHDNDWFADGMMDELIGMLGSLSKLIVPGRSSVMEYKKNRPKQSVIAEDLEVRYLVEGTVRKAGEKIRISASLTDAKTNTQIWNNKFDGTFDDIFDFQERVAREITEGLKLKLTPQDEMRMELKLTENPEAYELYTKGNTYSNRNTKQDYLYALDCLNEAVKLDPIFASAYALISRVHICLYRGYEHTDSQLSAAGEAVEKARQLNKDLPLVYYALSNLHLQRGESEKAIRAAIKEVECDPRNPSSHSHLGFIYSELWQAEEAAKHFEKALLLDPASLNTHSNLCLQYDRLKNINQRNRAAERALPYFQRHLKKNPDDQFQKMCYVTFLEYLGNTEESLRIVDELISTANADGSIVYNGACIIARQGHPQKAIQALAKAIEKGFADMDIFRNDPDLNGLRGTPEFEELMKKLQITNKIPT